jgi:alpha-amylase/alpha-mannosidase (GH57 family)
MRPDTLADMDRYICIHCHFYQPPRENPWLEAVELQDSAYPYHDWNERITAECYAPNSASRILSGDGKIIRITNNYANISFNFGPTLLSWMADNAPDTYAAILDADRESTQRFSGHGSAIAQAYNHMILPLANRRDKETQVHWGVRDFEYRFGRMPEGLWLPETAVDTETLEIVVAAGIKFTILAPRQARQVRSMRAGTRGVWHNVEGGKIDPTRPYVCKLPSGRTITLFFYDGPISQAVAFEHLLTSGENFAKRLLGGFSDARKLPQLVNIATDGETYGHHHPHGDMALSYALHYIETNQLAKITNYGEYLDKHPAAHEIEIVERTSWSCAHGLDRWGTDCGCRTRAGWNQQWRGPLRATLDWLRDALAEPYEQMSRPLLRDPWAARDGFIGVVLDRSTESLDHFLDSQCARDLTLDERVIVLKLLEMQRHLMLMYTSCGWFFDELTGIETVQVIFYAARALQLAQELFGDHHEQEFLDRLAQAQSNLPEMGNGADVYSRYVKPATVDLLGVTAHYAISAMFDSDREENTIFSYQVQVQHQHRQEAGQARLMVGRAQVTSRITLESQEMTYGVLHMGDHNLVAGVRPFHDQAVYEATVQEISQAFSRADLPASLRLMDKDFENTTFSIKSLFRDEQRRILKQIMGAILGEAESSYRQIYEHHAPLLRFLSETAMPLPKVLEVTAEFVINGALRRALREDAVDVDRVRGLLETAQRDKVSLDSAMLSYRMKRRSAELAAAFVAQPRDQELLERFTSLIELARTMPFEVELWEAQNAYWHVLQTVMPEMQASTSDAARAWMERFLALGELLRVGVDIKAVQQPIAA